MIDNFEMIQLILKYQKFGPACNVHFLDADGIKFKELDLKKFVNYVAGHSFNKSISGCTDVYKWFLNPSLVLDNFIENIEVIYMIDVCKCKDMPVDSAVLCIPSKLSVNFNVFECYDNEESKSYCSIWFREPVGIIRNIGV